MAVTPARAVALTGASQLVWTGVGVYRGLVARETGGASTVTLQVFDGTSAAGTLIDDVTVAAGGSATPLVPDGGVWVTTGLYVQKGGAGAVEGSVRVG